MAKKSKGNKKKAQAEKQRLLEEQNAILRQQEEEAKEIQGLVDRANGLKDIFSQFAAFKKCVRSKANLDLSLAYVKSGKDLSKEQLDWAFDLCKTNMEDIYNATEDMKWDSKIKRQELADAASRYVIVSHTDKSGAAEHAGFVHLRFEVEEEEPVLYVYELQLDSTVQRAGVGKFLMSLVELVAWKNSMDKVMLTVQRNNSAAAAFYAKLGYTPDEWDPSLCEPDEEFGYEILSKTRKAPASAAKKTKAEVEEEAPTDTRDMSDTSGEDDDSDEDSDEEFEEEDENGMDKAAIGEMIKQMMDEEGPIVSAVILETDGSVMEKELDMSPKKNTPADILGGSGTFLGQWEEGEAEHGEEEELGSVVIAMVAREQETLKANPHLLPAPLHEEKARGRILLLRMDGAARPMSFSKEEWVALVEKQSAVTA